MRSPLFGSAECERCLHSELFYDDDVRLCRRNPPGDSGWPTVRDDDWCGEFSPSNQKVMVRRW